MIIMAQNGKLKLIVWEECKDLPIIYLGLMGRIIHITT